MTLVHGVNALQPVVKEYKLDQDLAQILNRLMVVLIAVILVMQTKLNFAMLEDVQVEIESIILSISR